MQRARSSKRALESSQLVVTSHAMSSISTSDGDGEASSPLLPRARARLRFKRNHVAAYRSWNREKTFDGCGLARDTAHSHHNDANECAYSVGMRTGLREWLARVNRIRFVRYLCRMSTNADVVFLWLLSPTTMILLWTLLLVRIIVKYVDGGAHNRRNAIFVLLRIRIYRMERFIRAQRRLAAPIVVHRALLFANTLRYFSSIPVAWTRSSARKQPSI